MILTIIPPLYPYLCQLIQQIRQGRLNGLPYDHPVNIEIAVGNAVSCRAYCAMSITEAAKRLRVTRAELSCILNGKAAISVDMAVRLSILLSTSSEL
ncbi:helix-turn-helix domain-containing protein [Neisseria iguanae]|uniref:helix-turn-helix transcriptional regulator n=1 Tax=Neisseria iguanae TaxID=90242 RepID=UPI001FE55B38|nr:helix-turn-helix domain-containing protein [Neisseria iguanae]